MARRVWMAHCGGHGHIRHRGCGIGLCWGETDLAPENLVKTACASVQQTQGLNPTHKRLNRGGRGRRGGEGAGLLILEASILKQIQIEFRKEVGQTFHPKGKARHKNTDSLQCTYEIPFVNPH